MRGTLPFSDKHICSIYSFFLLSVVLLGYHGLYCEEEYNECLSAPCQNGATCRDLVNSYDCVCLPEYEGEQYYILVETDL